MGQEDAQFTFKAIGDYIGHRNPKHTDICSKIDLEALWGVVLGDEEAVP